jgi:predicted DNA-binding protein
VIKLKKRVTFTIEEVIIERLKKVSEETMIPQAKLVEKAIENILEQYKSN